MLTIHSEAHNQCLRWFQQNIYILYLFHPILPGNGKSYWILAAECETLLPNQWIRQNTPFLEYHISCWTILTSDTTENELGAWQSPWENLWQLPWGVPKLANIIEDILWPLSHCKCISGTALLIDTFPLTISLCDHKCSDG